ncbi:hypothetical protein [Xanthovirga aplysinae]|uniref:hypothetical protein n=1 Tax=Xanthovirga aplysinae TaxID=2529853 RepID=UPI0012BD4693|nr:hypothetical protein [Xanthovirga aplysinae]MTI29908.1 hypothetical protein [Xanthovirga aplysinae]
MGDSFGNELSGSPFIGIMGLFCYALAKDKVHDEYFQRLRLESVIWTFALSVFLVMVLYLINPNLKIEAALLVELEVTGFLLIYFFKKRTYSVN